jgi:hypothetical protein
MTYSSQFARNTNIYNQGLQSSFESIRANYRTELANASRAGENLQIFGSLAQSAGSQLAKRKDELTKRAKTRMAVAAMKLMAQPGFEVPGRDSTPEEQAEYNRLLDTAIRETNAGRSIEFGEKILGVSAKQRQFLEQGILNQRLTNVDSILRNQINEQQLPVASSSEIAQSVAFVTTNFINDNLTDLDEDAVLQASAKLYQASAKLRGEYQSVVDLNLSFEREQNIAGSLASGSISYDQAVKEAKFTVDPKTGKLRDNRKVHEFLFTTMKSLADNNALPESAIESYASSRVGGNKTNLELRPDKVYALQDARIKGQIADIDFVEDQIEASAIDRKREIITASQELLKAGRYFSPEQEKELLTDFQNRFPGESTEFFKEIMNTAEMQQNDLIAAVQEKIDTYGTITANDRHYSALTSDNQSKFSGKVYEVKYEDEIKQVETDLSNSINELMARITTDAGFLGGLSYEEGRAAKRALDFAKEELRKRSIIQGQAPATVFEDVMNLVEEKANQGEGEFGVFTNFSRPEDTRKLSAQLSNLLGSYPNGIPQDQIPNNYDLKTYLDRFGKGMEIDHHPVVNSIYNLSDGQYTKYQIADKLHEAYYGKPMKAPDVESEYKSIPKSDPTWRLLTRNPNSISNSQVSIPLRGESFHARQYVTPSLVPQINEEKAALEDAAQELGVDPLSLAAMIGFETAGTYNASIRNQFGYEGIIQFGEEERKTYGYTPGMSFADQVRGPMVRYLKDRFKKVGVSTQGASLEDLYTAVLTGNPKGNKDLADRNNTTVRTAMARMQEHVEAAKQRYGF